MFKCNAATANVGKLPKKLRYFWKSYKNGFYLVAIPINQRNWPYVSFDFIETKIRKEIVIFKAIFCLFSQKE